MPIPSIPGITVTGAWFPGQGSATTLTDLSGNNHDLVADGTGDPILLPTGGPAGNPVLQMQAGWMVALDVPIRRRGQGFLLLAKFTAEGIALNFANGDWLVSIAGSDMTTVIGGTTATASCSPGSWQVYNWNCSDDIQVGYVMGNYTNFTAAPGDASGVHVGLHSNFPGLFGGLVVYEQDSHATVLTETQINQLLQYGTDIVLRGSRENVIELNGNSIVGGVSALTSATTLQVQLQALLRNSAQVVSYAVSSIITPKLTERAPYVVDAGSDPGRNAVHVMWELTNDLALNAATAQEGYDHYAAYCTARKVIRPAAPVVLLDCIVRYWPSGQSSFDARRVAANALLAADFTTATDNPYVFLRTSGLNADVLIKASTHPAFADYTNLTYFLPDGTHPTAAGDAILAGLIAAAVVPYLAADANVVSLLGSPLSETTTGNLAASLKKFLNVASPTGTVNSLPGAIPGAAGGVFIAGTNAALNGLIVAGDVVLGGNLGVAGDTVYAGTVTYAEAVFAANAGNDVRVNIQQVNGVDVIGTGVAGDRWRPDV